MAYDKEFMKKYRGKPCVVCHTTHGTVCEHIKTKGSGGEDHPDNCHPICQKHHLEKNNKGVRHMAQSYNNYKRWLMDHNWHIDEFTGKWMRLTNRGFDIE